MHKDFSCNANVQSKLGLILDALTTQVATAKKASGEELIAVKRNNLIEGIRYWLKRNSEK